MGFLNKHKPKTDPYYEKEGASENVRIVLYDYEEEYGDFEEGRCPVLVHFDGDITKKQIIDFLECNEFHLFGISRISWGKVEMGDFIKHAHNGNIESIYLVSEIALEMLKEYIRQGSFNVTNEEKGRYVCEIFVTYSTLGLAVDKQYENLYGHCSPEELKVKMCREKYGWLCRKIDYWGLPKKAFEGLLEQYRCYCDKYLA